MVHFVVIHRRAKKKQITEIHLSPSIYRNRYHEPHGWVQHGYGGGPVYTFYPTAPDASRHGYPRHSSRMYSDDGDGSGNNGYDNAKKM